ncbi:MAG: hypothetical protein M3015_16210 [Bacteroidota bacterium]|nr:hypothetical protein [Bacteroidota bacterium]
MNTTNFYPVFEADQMLTNRHLNNLFNYLEQQDRLTRIKLIGSGIVCGLEVSFQQSDSISISKGCGLTSQGYLITFCSAKFTHIITYATKNFPADILFIKQCEDDKSNPKPFYRDEFKDGIFQLLTSIQFENLNADERQNAIALVNNSSVDLNKFVVVLFLEADEEALKNCDTNDCNDKGSQMDFEVKALLVEKEIIDKIKQEQVVPPAGNPSVKPDLHHVELKRYNVPVQDLKTADEVLQAFANLVDDAKLKSIAEVLNYCFVHYYYLLENETSNPFENVWERFKKLRDEILKNNPILIQYFYDFIDDVLKAYYEFKHKVFEASSSCCGDEMKFPLHLTLGEATVNTASQVRSGYREYFIYSPLFSDQKNKLAEVRLLFTRLRLLITEVDFIAITDFEKRLVEITPSRYGYIDLSGRCIPYHYKVTDKGNELYRYWSYEKTSRGNERFNLGYNAFQYCAADNVVRPLLYDIERFDFFRIEGHIGKNITTAISLVKSIQQQNNLPFDIAALSADFIGALVKGEEPQCVIQDLESDYRMLIADFICKIHDAWCFVARLPFTLPVRILSFTAATFSNASSEDASAVKNTIAFNPAVLEKLDHPFASALVNEFQAIKKYVKGDTLLKLCNPAANTIGSAFIQMKGDFSNPVTINTAQPVTLVQFHAFEFIDAVESVLELVMNFELSEVNTLELKSRYDRFEKEVGVVSHFAISFLQQLENNDKAHLNDLASDLYLDLLIFNLEMLLHLCFVEQVEALKNEYLRRMAQYRLAKNFSYYFKTHGGIEHKAGVPRGGTFILVYYEELRNRFIDKSSLFINQELSTLMLTHFREIIKADVPLDTLTYKTKLLQTAILYKDPELYARFKDVLTKYLDDCKDLPDDIRTDLTGIINEEPKRPHFQLTDGMVIADFYIPYMCCSDCPPVAYILPEKQQDPAEDPTIKIDKNSFCSNDNTQFPIIVTPKNGAATGTGVSVLADGNYVFVPAAAGAGLHTLTYTANGKTLSLQVEVIATPKPQFSFTTNVQDGVMTVILKNESLFTNDQTTYEWLLDGVKFSEKKDPDPINFKVDSLPHTILLNESNGQCPSHSDEVKIELELDKREIKVCRDVKKLALESGLPPGGATKILINEGNIMDDQLVIHPASANVSQTTVFNVSYLVNGKQTDVSITVVVVNANFSMELTRAIAATNVPPMMLTVKPLGESLTESTWTVGQDVNLIPNVKDGIPFPLSNPNFNPEQPIFVNHHAEIKTDNETCTDDKEFNITRDIIAKHLNNGPFNNTGS